MTALELLPFPTYTAHQNLLASPKTALLSRIHPSALGDSNNKLFEYSSPTGLGSLIGLSSANLSYNQCEEQDSSDEISIYDRVDAFLDEEMLFVVSPSPKIMRPTVRLTRFKTSPELTLGIRSPIKADTDSGSDSDSLSLNMPSFLARRAISNGSARNVKTTLMSVENDDIFASL